MGCGRVGEPGERAVDRLNALSGQCFWLMWPVKHFLQCIGFAAAGYQEDDVPCLIDNGWRKAEPLSGTAVIIRRYANDPIRFLHR